MKIRNKKLLRLIFKLKGNFKKGLLPENVKKNEIFITPFYHDAKCAINISADFELAWAFRRRTKEYREKKAQNGRQNVPLLLNMFEKYDIPITWATVGHLFLKNCYKMNNIAHPEMERPLKNHLWKGDWYKHDPCENYKEKPYWYAPDLITDIIKSKINHEFGTHSFSHIDFSSKYTTRKLVLSELNRCKKVMKDYDIVPKSLVYPYNKIGHNYLNLFYSLGITSVRQRHKKIRISYPEKTSSGVYLIYESMNLRKSVKYDYEKKAEIFIHEASKKFGVFHLWFHPSDEQKLFKNEFKKILNIISKKKKEGVAWVCTMKNLVAYCEAREKTHFEWKRVSKKVEINLFCEIDKDRFGHPEITIKIPFKKKHKITIEYFDEELQKKLLQSEKYSYQDDYLSINISCSAKKIIISPAA